VLKEKLKELKLPDGFEVVIEPWPYGAPEIDDGARRFFQALLFARDTRSHNPDSNFYAYPLPFIPVMDALTKEIIRIDQLATGGNDDDFQGGTDLSGVLDYCQSSEYVPELLPGGTRKDLRPLSVLQPDGPSFTISDGNLVEWQKWRMRISFNSREGAVIHDIRYQGRPILYRLSLSEMVSPRPVPYM
jgi:primary-amine oxidase